MSNLNKLPLRPRDTHASFTSINKSALQQPSEPTTTSRAAAEARPPKLRAQIFAKLSLVHPTMKAAIVTSNANGECYAHVIDESEKVGYSSGAQGSIKVALEVLLALFEEDVIGSIRVEGMELRESEEEEEEEVDYEMEVD